MIQNIKIKNFKSLQNLDLPCQNLNLLTGLNGVGKSSLIQVLLILRQSYQKGFFDRENKSLSFDGEYAGIGNFSDAIYDNYEKIEEFIRFEITFDNKIAFWQTQQDYVDAKELTELKVATSDLNKELLQQALFATNKFQYTKAERIGSRNSLRTNLSKVATKDFGIDGAFALQYFMEKANQKISIENLAHHSNSDDFILETQMNSWLSEISPNVKIKAKYTDVNKTNIESYFSYGALGKSHKAENVGFGVSYVFTVILALLTAEKGDLLLIENPEAHLHPKGQSKLAELMCLAAQNGVQIFCETHSDHIVNGLCIATKNYYKKGVGISADNANIYFFEKDNEQKSVVSLIKTDKDGAIYKLLPNGKKSAELPNGFIDEWGNAMLNLI